MLRLNFYNFVLWYILILISIFATTSYSLPRTYLNDPGPNSTSGNLTFSLSSNLTLNDNLNHTFEGRSSGSNADWDVEYVASNTTGFLLRIRVNDQAGTADDVISAVDCVNTGTLSGNICGPDCGGLDFAQFHNFTLLFNSTSLAAKIFIDDVSRGEANVCTNATQIGSIRFSRSAGLSYAIQNTVFTANNKNPTFIGNLPNITWEEDTSTSFNISGNFSDPNNDTLSYNIVSGVENINISINSSTGIVNLTSAPNFNGIRYVIFLSNDSENITFSNNVTLNITNVNDVPVVSNVTLNNTDFLNRTNGSLVAGWAFSDIDNDLPQGNETLWYINGSENQSLRNATSISAANTTKTQNWTFSVRVFDGTNFSDFANSTPLIIQNSAPTHSIPLITSNDEHNRKNGTLTCNNQSTSDLDNDVVTNFIRWHKNNALVDSAADSTTLNAGNHSKNDNITCEIAPNDGTANGTSLNSSNFTILNAVPLLNSSVQNKTWSEDASATINLSSSFADIDGDNMTYNFTSVSNIAISVNNSTGISTLTPDADFNGIRYVIFFAYDGTNLTSSNNVTLTINDVPEPSSSSSSSGGGGNSGSSGGGIGYYICDLNWECGEWSECLNGKQNRKCRLIQVPNFISLEKCPQHRMPEQSRGCTILHKPANKETCSDKIQNQGEAGIDCGGICSPCSAELKIEKNETQQTKPSVAPPVIATPGRFGIKLLYILLILLLILAILFINYRLLKKKANKLGKYQKKRQKS